MTLQDGWRIFSVQEPEHKMFSFAGCTFSTTHFLIAKKAWQLRPIKYFDVSDWIIPASIRAGLPFRVASLAAYLVDSESNDAHFANKLALKWNEKSMLGKPHVQTRNIAALATRLINSGTNEAAVLLQESLKERIRKPDSESWLAILALYYLSLVEQNTSKILSDIKITQHIKVADFSIASGRALKFFRIVKGTDDYNAVLDQLGLAFKGHIDWALNSHLMHYYFINYLMKLDGFEGFHLTYKWLERNPEDSFVRTKFLAAVVNLPAEQTQSINKVILETRAWLERNPEDSSVRTKFLA